MKTTLKVATALVPFFIFLVILFVWHYLRSSHLPSDKNAQAFFGTHRSELNELVAVIHRQPAITYVSPDGTDDGTNTTDPSYVQCAKLLKKMGAQFLRNDAGAIEIYFWGSGCAICHDSYEGFAYIEPKASFLQRATVVRSLADEALPMSKAAPEIEDGDYILPLRDNWYIIRWEDG